MGRGGSTGLQGADLAGAVRRLPGEMHVVILRAGQAVTCFASYACRINDVRLHTHGGRKFGRTCFCLLRLR